MQKPNGAFAAYGPAYYGGYYDANKSPGGAYGAAYQQQAPMYDPSMEGKLLPARRERSQLPMYLAICFILPSVVFFAVYSITCSPLHYKNPDLQQAVYWLDLLLVIGLAFPMLKAWQTQGASGDIQWYTFLFITSLVAWIAGAQIGEANYSINVVPYMDVQQLNEYPSVDPSVSKGQALMDAGRLTFVTEAKLDISKSIGFKNADLFCAAPVTLGNQTLGNYDFWAVGTNCCSGHAPDFSCGEYLNANAHSGLRLLKEEQRPFFRLAVKEAEVKHNIQANHPIFFYWMQDPLVEITSYKDTATGYLVLGVMVFFAVQLVAVLLAAATFSSGALD